MTMTSTVWASVGGAEAAVSLLERDVAAGRVAHAYLFAGAAGRLPLDVALAFGAALVCERSGCGSCEACLRVARRAHPDVELLEPAGMQLLVEQVRDAVRAASRRPVAAARRVVIVDGADRMNPTAQNAFLKTLEEPPASTTIVLLAASPEALLETVRSRCREISFKQPPPTEVAALLRERGVGEAEARAAARVGGELARATELATDEAAGRLRAAVVARVLEPTRDPGEALEAAAWLAAATKELRDRVAADHEADRQAFGSYRHETKAVADQRLRREQRRAEQDALDRSIDDILSVLRDVVALSTDPEASILNEDAAIDLADRASGSRGPAAVIGAMGDIERARRRLRSNANVLLTLEEVFLAVHRSLHRRPGGP